MNLTGLVFPKGEVPAGYVKPNRHRVTRPRKDNKEVSKLFQQDGTVVLFQPMQEFRTWLGCPVGYSYHYDGGSVSRCIGSFLNPIGLYWFDETGPILLQIPDVEFYHKKALEENFSVDGDVLSWRMNNEGAREILKEEWDFIVATHRHEKE
jgi:hypothetical protein